VDTNVLNRLLSQGESSHLDYKSEPYRFVGASDGDKAELLKDIFAMANAWRDTDAFILIGVQEQPGRKADVVGIVDHLDDADLQQFVNSKTNRPVQFSYKSLEEGGRSIGIIHVPLQQRGAGTGEKVAVFLDEILGEPRSGCLVGSDEPRTRCLSLMRAEPPGGWLGCDQFVNNVLPNTG
jgi:hypothetical protein